MKAIILISSIFYILGLKIGNKIELVKKSDSNEKIITQKVKMEKPADCCKFTEELANKTTCDTIQGGSSYSDAILKTKE
jgi:hypothetical protein